MFNINNKKGVTLLVTILLMSVVFFLGLYFLSFSLTEKRISRGQAKGVKTYHLAEAGIEEMVWRLKHNQEYKDNFESDEDWSAEFSRNSPFGGNGSYEVSIDNTGQAEGDIESVGRISDSAGNTSQRIVKTTVYKATASSSRVDGYALFSDNDIDIFLTDVEVVTSSVHANHDIWSGGPKTEFHVDNDLGAVNRFSQDGLVDVIVEGEISDSYDHSPPPDYIEMPAVSFDDVDDPKAFKNKADVVYTADEFDDMLDDSSGGALTLDDDITYVEGGIEIGQEIDLTINGLLAVNGNIRVGKSCGKETNLVINRSSSSPSGLVSKGNIKFDNCFNSADISGVIYAAKDVEITNFKGEMAFEGGMYGRNIEVFSIWQGNSMKFNKEVVHNSLDVTEFSPVVTVEHWEEEY